MPTENALAELLSVSRPVVREALARLRDDGLVVSRRGSGTYVRRAPVQADRTLAPLSSIADMRRCLEFRISLECETAWHAARELTAEGWARIASALDQLENDFAQGEIGVEPDYLFHLAVAAATENRFFLASMTAMRDPITVGMTITRNFSFLRTEERRRSLHEEHVAIAKAIEGRDPDAARQAMHRHLTNAMQRAFDGTLS